MVLLNPSSGRTRNFPKQLTLCLGILQCKAQTLRTPGWGEEQGSEGRPESQQTEAWTHICPIAYPGLMCVWEAISYQDRRRVKWGVHLKRGLWPIIALTMQ